ncbi:MAG TPA: DUF4157 domain-containing protein [Candidatus Cybelea sp.]
MLGNHSASNLLALPPLTGRPLPHAARAVIDAKFGDVADHIRVHTGDEAAEYAQSAEACAYAFGYDIVFGAEQFSPATRAGRRLLAHEVAHVLQQTLLGLPVATPEQAERDAKAYAADVLAGRPARVTRSTPVRPARQNDPVKNEDIPPLGTFRVGIAAGEFVYTYNIEDAKKWPDERLRSFTNYLLDAFPGATTAMAAAYLHHDPSVHVIGQKPSEYPSDIKIITYTVRSTLHSQVVRWMHERYPGIAPKQITAGTRKIPKERQQAATGGGGTGDKKDDEPLEVTVHGPPRRNKRADKVPASGEPSLTPDQGIKASGRGSEYGKPGGDEHGIIKFEPLGELVVTPALSAYVANSQIRARVRFLNGNPWRYVLNFFPSHASFSWTVYKDGKKLYSNPVWTTGRIEYGIDFEEPGTYTVSVEVSSDEFIDDKKLNLTSDPLVVIEEKDRDRQLFESSLIGPEREKHFTRDARGRIIAKPDFVPLSIDAEIDGINASIAAIARLEKDGKFSASDAQTWTNLFKEQLAGLKKIKQHVGSVPYQIAGTFLNREDNSSFPLRVFMNRTGRGETADKHAFVDVELYESTLTPGEPRRSQGHGESSSPSNKPTAYAEAELSAISRAMGNWQFYNEFPDGTAHFGIQLIEVESVREWILDTHTTRKKVRSILTGAAAVGGVALLVASPFTAGGSAPVGVLLMEAAIGGATAGATVALAIASIDERIRTNTFHFDARFYMDMTALVTAFVGVGGAMRALPSAVGTAKNGMLVFNIGAGVANFALMTVATRNAIDQENASYFASIANVTDPAAKANMEEQHRARLAGIMGSACVSGGIILAATGIAAKQAFEGEPPGGLPPGRRPPPDRKIAPELHAPGGNVAPRPPVKPPVQPDVQAPAKLPVDPTAPPSNVPPPNAPPPNVPPPNVPPTVTAGGAGRAGGPDEMITLYHGTRQPGYEGLSKGIDVTRSPGAHQDFSRGFYMSENEAVAEQAAGMRPEPGGTGRRYVLRWDIPKSKLGKIVDIRPGGKDRAAWEAFLKEPPSFTKLPGFPARPGFRTNEEYLSGLGIEQRGVTFEEFLKQNNLSDADTIIGEIGTPTTSGAAALPNRVSTQVAIRSQKVADELNAIASGPQGPPPVTGRPTIPPATPPPANRSTPPPPSSDPSITAVGPMVRVPIHDSGAPATVLEIGAGPRPTNLGIPGDPSLVTVTPTDVNPTRPGVTFLDANQPIPQQMRGQFDTVMINNPHGYTPDVANVGTALKAGGRIIIQGRTPANPNFRTLVEMAQRGEAPPGYAVTSVQTWPDPATAGEQSPAVLGSDFGKTTGAPLSKPVNARVIFEKLTVAKFNTLPQGQTPQTLGAQIGTRVAQDVQAAKGTGGPSWINRILDAVKPLALSPADSAGTIEAATRAAGYKHGLRTTLPDGTVVVTSARTGPNNFIVGIRPDGRIVRGMATIEMGAGVPGMVRVSNVEWTP